MTHASISRPDEPVQTPELRAVPSGGGATRRPRGRLWKSGQNWTRVFHVYTSMAALLLVLFFGISGITLNHPDWTFGIDPISTSTDGTLPIDWVADDGTVDFLSISEYLRSSENVDGEVTDFGVADDTATISYREPGYSADVFVDVSTGDYRLTVEQQGWIGVMNDLHKGRDSAGSWNWTIDAAGIFLVVIAVTGLGLQLFLSKRRRAALWTAAGGLIVAIGVAAISVI